ncbi:MAG: hypothetical protein IIW33_01380 [Oscillospiraceae bacterium]|nr:hypothetical protein [Oscillospiraceae bacterium]
MQNLNSKNLAAYQLWAADEMKRFAETTGDPQLKKKYEQMAALNRSFYEQLSAQIEDQQAEGKAAKEAQMLMRAYYIQKALFDVFSSILCAAERPEGLDKICDREIMICREILTEAENRENVINL